MNAATALTAAQVVAHLRATFASGRTQPVQWRIDQLNRLRALFTENRDDILTALYADLRKPRAEAEAVEIDYPIREIDYTLAELARWLAPEDVDSAALVHLPLGASAATRLEPLGTVLIIAPWNYPIQLQLVPLIGALAAGNTALLKPSELTTHSAALLSRLVPRYLDPDAVTVVQAGVEETTALLAERFDHIFYTGNATVGRIVMRAAAEHLTPVTLELGGKSPAYVDRGTDLSVVADRLAESKFRNAGQTCVAPDYVLADRETSIALASALEVAVERRYGRNPQSADSYGRIVNERHFDRVAALISSGHIAFGGQTDRQDLYIAPTVLVDVDPHDPVMRDEIFGPVLPIVETADLDEAIAFINARDKPLALYGFTEDDAVRQRLDAETSSGGIGFGLSIAHLRIPDLPFGGVGASGMGNYHGWYSLATFSHRKARLDVPLR
ncbi:aldehyde dehydrogenase family protein [Nocardia sp. NPDC055049]